MATNPHLDDFILLREAPALCGRSLYTIRRYVREGKLTRYKLFGDRYLKRSDLVPTIEPHPMAEARKGNGSI